MLDDDIVVEYDEKYDKDWDYWENTWYFWWWVFVCTIDNVGNWTNYHLRTVTYYLHKEDIQ